MMIVWEESANQDTTVLKVHGSFYWSLEKSIVFGKVGGKTHVEDGPNVH